MGYKRDRKIQNLYLLNHVKAKVLDVNHYDSNGFLKPEYALTELELLALKELRYDNATSIFNMEHATEQTPRRRRINKKYKD